MSQNSKLDQFTSVQDVVDKMRGPPGDVPDECENSNCIRPPTHVVRFKDPKEWVYYCRKHGKQAERQYAKARSIQELDI